jgi:uncharacterized protein
MRVNIALLVVLATVSGRSLVAADDLALELIEAARWGDVETLQWALNEGADPDARDAEGASAMEEAVRNRRYPAVTVLLAAGADPDTRTTRNEAVIVLAARGGDLDVIQALIAAGANVDARDTDGLESISYQTGTTALWVASRWGMVDAARELLTVGADPRVQDFDGVPAWAVARSYGHDQIFQMLESAGAIEPATEDDGPL